MAIFNLLEYTAEGVTCFRDKIATAFLEAANVLQEGGHGDFLHRDYTLSYTAVFGLFFAACKLVAFEDSKNIDHPLTPRQLTKHFEEALLQILTDPIQLAISSSLQAIVLKRHKHAEP